jgi:hypothetical protein|nr:MAG TPA: hypothetical protein [Caudoviricetes sp.]
MRRKRSTYKIDVDFDTKFWALLPALNINFHSWEFEFEWLCLGIYIGKLKYDIREIK